MAGQEARGSVLKVHGLEIDAGCAPRARTPARTRLVKTPSGRGRACARAPGAFGELAVAVAVASRQRNSSSAMFSAASTASRSESPLGVDSAAARIFSSTYWRQPRHVLRRRASCGWGNAGPRISTGMTRPTSVTAVCGPDLQVQRFELFEHVATRARMTSRSSLSVDSSAATDSLGASRARIASISRASRWFSSSARACSLSSDRPFRPAASAFPRADRSARAPRSDRCFRHNHVLPIVGPRRAPARARRESLEACCTSASVSVRSGA